MSRWSDKNHHFRIDTVYVWAVPKNASGSVTLCAATGQPPHPATRRTGYCDLHHVEYERARSAHNSRVAKSNLRGEPPEGDEWRDNIEFSPTLDVWTLLSAETKERLRQHSVKVSIAASQVAPVATSTKAFYEARPVDVLQRLGALLEATTALQEALAEALGEANAD